MLLPFPTTSSSLFRVVALALAVALAGCDGVSSGSSSGGADGPGDGSFDTSNCTIPTDRIVSGCDGADCIPSIDGITPGDDRLRTVGEAEGLDDGNRIIGLVLDGQALAVPHNVLWSHEIVNVDNWGGRRFAVTYCPLTGSSLAFDRSVIDGAEFGVSGLLFDNNLVMYDRRDRQSLWPQMSRRATCGANVGTELSMVPLVEMTWGRWRELHPDTKVVSDGGDFNRSYPYGNYESPNTDPLVDMPDDVLDTRRPLKERVLGIPDGADGGIALPFGELKERGDVGVVTLAAGGTQATVFWNRAAQAARAFETSRSFSVRNGKIVDDETGSAWSVEGRAIEGPLADDGATLDSIDTAYVAFWFAWAAFQPNTVIWTTDG
ncbi:MAG: DUF3179 domain-containing protein [Salinibacter sp.]